MGTGKSSFGRKLAAKSGKVFIDLDEMIIQQTGKSITNIFENLGEDYFRQLEHDLLKHILENKNIVLATGGGTPCFFDNITLINSHAYSIWLSGNSTTLLQRIGENATQRPLLSGAKTEQERIDILEKLLAERESYYAQANLKLEIIGLRPEFVLNAYADYCK